MKFIVGYQMTDGGTFADDIVSHRDQIKEVYFSWGDMPSGRRGLSDDCGEILFEKQIRQRDDLKKLSAAGLHFNLLLNANCYGEDSQSRSFFYRIGNTVDFVQREFGLTSVTTASPLIAKFLHENFEGLDVRASVNMEIGTVEGLSYVADVFDSFYAKREFNRNLKQLCVLREWCDKNGKEMYLLANSGCLNNCSAHAFHDNLVAHEAEIAKMDNGYDFRGVCWEFLEKPENKFLWLERTNFIRPEDIELYDGLVPAMKLATRVNSAPARVLEAYVGKKYRGSVMELLEPNHSGAFYPSYIENANFDVNFAKTVMSCNKNCEECRYCADVINRACVKLAVDPSAKV